MGISGCVVYLPRNPRLGSNGVFGVSVTVSDRCKALCVFEIERKALFAESASITSQQREALESVVKLSHKQHRLLTKIVALERAAAGL